MTFFGYIMLFGWIPLSALFFYLLKPHRAVLFSIIGGWLFLPVIDFDLPGLPTFSKSTSIALGLIIGSFLFRKIKSASFHWKIYDLPVLVFCLSPFFTSLSNKLGFTNGLSDVFSHFLGWGIPYLAGRIHFTSDDKIKDLCFGIIVGGLIYLPLCLYEIRMSPQLSNIFYGFFPHSFLQHIRYGGFRPIVFMKHGLMVSLWMANSTIAAFWLWQNRELMRIKGIPMFLLIVPLTFATVLCKSANGWVALFLGFVGYFILRFLKSLKPFQIFILLIPLYLFLRIFGGLPITDIVELSSGIFDVDRTASLEIRLKQEDLFREKALQRPFLGWGGYGRYWPIDEQTGQSQIKMVDALWTVIFGKFGFIVLSSMVLMILIGPWLTLLYQSKIPFDSSFFQTAPLALSFIVVLFMLDSLVNAMFNPVYILISGGLCARYSILSNTS